MTMLKRLGRCLLGVPRLVQWFRRQPPPKRIKAFSDSDFAGCLRTRRSSSCAVLMHGTHMLKLISSTQTVEALSSGEAEWYALVHAASAAIGMANLGRDYGLTLGVSLAGDATACSGIAHRRGVGKIRHLEVRTLWLQRHITERKIKLEREPGVSNPADLGTKHLPRADLYKHLERLSYAVATGKCELALKAAVNLEPVDTTAD